MEEYGLFDTMVLAFNLCSRDFIKLVSNLFQSVLIFLCLFVLVCENPINFK